MKTATGAAALVWVLAGASAAEEAPLSPFALGRIDAHVHFFAESRPVLDVLDRLNVTGVNICVVDRYDAGYETAPPQHLMARRLAETSPGRLPWIAALDDGTFASPGFAKRAIADIERALAKGARGVKIYKSMGMELRRPDGTYVLPDDPVFAPVFTALADRGTTVYAHLAEPIAAWDPLDPKSPDYGYYKNNPAWYVHGRAGVPSKEAILAARDRLLEKHPRLRVVGCHLGEHGRRRGRHRASPRAPSELRGRHRGPGRAPHAPAAREGARLPDAPSGPRALRDGPRDDAGRGRGPGGAEDRGAVRAGLGLLRHRPDDRGRGTHGHAVSRCRSPSCGSCFARTPSAGCRAS